MKKLIGILILVIVSGGLGITIYAEHGVEGLIVIVAAIALAVVIMYDFPGHRNPPPPPPKKKYRVMLELVNDAKKHENSGELELRDKVLANLCEYIESKKVKKTTEL